MVASVGGSCNMWTLVPGLKTGWPIGAQVAGREEVIPNEVHHDKLEVGRAGTLRGRFPEG
jgi:hypothetical protein